MADSSKQGAIVRAMNPWVLHLQKLGLELKCPLCLELLNGPSLLPCNHIFCNSCLPKSTQLGSECPLCKAHYVDRDRRPMSIIETIVKIYRSLDAFGNLFQSSSSDSGFEKLSKESFEAGLGKQLGQVSLNCSAENGVHKTETEGNCNLQLKFRNKDREMDSNGGDEDRQKADTLPVSSQFGRVHECGSMQAGTHQVYQLSASSPPLDDIKSSENGSNDQGDYNSPQNPQASRLAKRTPDGRTKEERHDSPTSRNDVNSRDSKRHKKLNMPTNPQTQALGICNLKSGHVSVKMCDAQTPALLPGSSIVKTVCGFCQSSTISQDTGPMLHFVNGKLVDGDEAFLPHTIHVHRICIEWAPQVYFIDDQTVKNLKAEVVRGSKLKCSGCEVKGAALGCYHKSCRRSYHVICAKEIAGCRWDYENYLLLCPSHTSVKFPNEKKKSKNQLVHPQVPDKIAPQQSSFWTESSNGAEEWVFSGSALSSEEKVLLVQFGTMIGVPVTKFWRPTVTHVIAATDEKGACIRTLKVLMAILNGRWVLTIDWVKACMNSINPVDEEPYEVSLDNHGSENGPRTGRLSVLNNAPKLFSGFNFYFLGDFESGYKEDLERLVKAAGGNLIESKEELEQKSHELSETPSRSLVVYNPDPPQGCKLGEEVTILWQRLNEAQDLAAKIGFQVIGHTWLLESIASYKLQPFVSLY
ncbi:BRCA1-associated RING domain protein 1 [Euphorbia lathyris]|uniref:BRCA1-associated RING domain protein 1 n=1 Tax=Euphorbia lathyris TaxID=212925 RepID=UPI0033137152